MKSFYVPFFLADTRVDRNRWEVTLAQELVQFGGSDCAFYENDNLVEGKLIKQLIKTSILLSFFQLDVVLLKAIEGKLCLIINVDFERVLHEFLANGANLLGKSGTEHHDLFLWRCSSEDLLNIATHIYNNINIMRL